MEMKPLAYAVNGGYVVKFDCCYCGEWLALKQVFIMTHPTHTGLIFKKLSIYPFVGKAFKVPVFELEEM